MLHIPHSDAWQHRPKYVTPDMRAVIIPIDLTQLSLTLDVKNAPCNSSSLSITGAVSGDPRDGSHPFSQAVHESMHFA